MTRLRAVFTPGSSGNKPLRTKRSLLPAMVVIAALLLSPAVNATLTDSLSSGFGLTGTGDWADSAWIGWDVVWLPGESLWQYSYTFQLTQEKKDALSFFALELSSNFTESELVSLDTNFGYTRYLGPFMTGALMPEPFPYGLKLDVTDNTQPSDGVYSITLKTPRHPVWGDFFAKDGKATDSDAFNTVRNLGYTVSDWDPPESPQYNVYFVTPEDAGWHIIVPDSRSGDFVIPEPSALALMGLAVCGGVATRIRRRRRED